MKILNVWFPVDCTNGSNERGINSFYFATPPEKLIYSHIPKSDYWQLLEPPLSLQRFKHRITPSYHYFNFGELLAIAM